MYVVVRQSAASGVFTVAMNSVAAAVSGNTPTVWRRYYKALEIAEITDLPSATVRSHYGA